MRLQSCNQSLNPNLKLNSRIVQMVDKEPGTTSKEMQAEVQGQGTMSDCTIRHYLSNSGLNGRRPRVHC